MNDVIKKIESSKLSFLKKDNFFIIKDFFEEKDLLLKTEEFKLTGYFEDDVLEINKFEDLTIFYFNKWKIEKKTPNPFWGKEMMTLDLVKIKIIEVWEEV